MDNNILTEYKKTKNILNDMREIIEVSRKNAYQAINIALVNRNWLLGKRIAEEEMNNKSRAEYGMEVIKQLSEDLKENTAKVLRNQIYIAFILSINCFLTFSTQCVENLKIFFLGHITEH